MTGFILDLGALPTGTSQVRVRLPVEELGLSAADWRGLVLGVFDVERNGDRISVRGKVEASARVECVRCLRGCELPVEAPLDVFAERAGVGLRLDEEELERDDYMKFHDGRTLDLREDARGALILELPIAPHCREDCRGLCPRCGADLNDGPCVCETNGTSAEPGES
jgi:uncharacterized protein